MQSAHHAGTTPHPIGRLPHYEGEHALMRYYQSVELREGKSRLATSKKLIRIGRRLIIDRTFYVPEHWLGPNASINEHEVYDYYEVLRKSLREKWKPFDLSGVLLENNYLIKLQKQLDEVLSRKKPSGEAAAAVGKQA
jgi:hypothetical protein